MLHVVCLIKSKLGSFLIPITHGRNVCVCSLSLWRKILQYKKYSCIRLLSILTVRHICTDDVMCGDVKCRISCSWCIISFPLYCFHFPLHFQDLSSCTFRVLPRENVVCGEGEGVEAPNQCMGRMTIPHAEQVLRWCSCWDLDLGRLCRRNH